MSKRPQPSAWIAGVLVIVAALAWLWLGTHEESARDRTSEVSAPADAGARATANTDADAKARAQADARADRAERADGAERAAGAARVEGAERAGAENGDAQGAAARRARATAVDLPPEAHATLAAIARGGPFRYRQDGAVFQNRERRLPPQPRGYYREYTVETPGSRDRGPRRIVTGGDPPTEYYYTSDHYRSFRPIEVQR